MSCPHSGRQTTQIFVRAPSSCLSTTNQTNQIINFRQTLSTPRCISNYRPLTVIPSMCGTFSKLLNSRLTEVVEQHRLLGETQNGFRKDRSGIDSAFILNSILWKCMAKRKTVNLAFLVLQKARQGIYQKIYTARFSG